MTMVFFLIFFIKAYVVGTHLKVNAIQMSTHSICLYKEVDKRYTGCNLMATELLDCVLIGICAVIRSNRVHIHNSRQVECINMGINIFSMKTYFVTQVFIRINFEAILTSTTTWAFLRNKKNIITVFDLITAHTPITAHS